MPGVSGINDAAARVAAHARNLARLQAELARTEFQRKAGRFGIAAGMLVGAAVLGFFAIELALALVIAALAIVLPVWLAILIVFAVVLVGAALLAMIGVRIFKAGGPPVPNQAMAQAKLAADAFKGKPVAVATPTTAPPAATAPVDGSLS